MVQPTLSASNRTRQALLVAAHGEIHEHGFRAASLDRIVAAAGVTKGALYYHFHNKRALGIAVVDEIIRRDIRVTWVDPVTEAGDPIDRIQASLHAVATNATLESVMRGCPLNNLAQELSFVEADFQSRTKDVFAVWRDAVASALKRGQEAGSVRTDIDADKCAVFVIAAVAGTQGLAKNLQTITSLADSFAVLADYLDTLRHESHPR